MKTIGDVFAWSLLQGAVLEATLQALGLTADQPVRLLADIAEADVEDVKKEVKVGDAKMTPAAKGMLGTAWRVSQIVLGKVMSQAAKQEEENK